MCLFATCRRKHDQSTRQHTHTHRCRWVKIRSRVDAGLLSDAFVSGCHRRASGVNSGHHGSSAVAAATASTKRRATDMSAYCQNRSSEESTRSAVSVRESHCQVSGPLCEWVNHTHTRLFLYLLVFTISTFSIITIFIIIHFYYLSISISLLSITATYLASYVASCYSIVAMLIYLPIYLLYMYV